MLLLSPTTFYRNDLWWRLFKVAIFLAPVGLGKTAGVLWHIFRLLPEEMPCNQCPQSMLYSLFLSSL